MYITISAEIVKGIFIAFLISFGILKVWQKEELKQFGKLQQDRKCDNIIWWLYFIALVIGFAT